MSGFGVYAIWPEEAAERDSRIAAIVAKEKRHRKKDPVLVLDITDESNRRNRIRLTFPVLIDKWGRCTLGLPDADTRGDADGLLLHIKRCIAREYVASLVSLFRSHQGGRCRALNLDFFKQFADAFAVLTTHTLAEDLLWHAPCKLDPTSGEFYLAPLISERPDFSAWHENTILRIDREGLTVWHGIEQHIPSACHEIKIKIDHPKVEFAFAYNTNGRHTEPWGDEFPRYTRFTQYVRDPETGIRDPNFRDIVQSIISLDVGPLMQHHPQIQAHSIPIWLNLMQANQQWMRFPDPMLHGDAADMFAFQCDFFRRNDLQGVKLEMEDLPASINQTIMNAQGLNAREQVETEYAIDFEAEAETEAPLEN